ncbi:unnamed protein product, partial [Owenia fusiformis]
HILSGTKAVAATGVLMSRTSPPAIICDHPFIFLIRDVISETIVFMGRVIRPESDPVTLQPPHLTKSRKNPFGRQPQLDATDEHCKGICKPQCRIKCFKNVQKQMNIKNMSKAKNQFNKEKHSRHFGYIVIPYRKCRSDCKTSCVQKCKKRS